MIKVISMGPLSRILSRRVLYTYNIARLLHNVSLASNCGHFPTSRQRLLTAVNPATKHCCISRMSGEGAMKIATYEDVKGLADRKDVLLIDVREPSELKETGLLPGSINIPVGQVENVLKYVSPDDFAKQYGRPKPDFNFPLVFSCRSGKRSEMAGQAALKLGYKDITNYSGGWLDWEKHTKQT